MEEQGKKWLAIAFAVVSIGIVFFVFGKTFFSNPNRPDRNRPVYLMCKNCKGLEVSSGEFRDMMSDQPGGMMPMMGGPMILTCPKCNQKSCMVATKCEKCETIFIPQMMTGQNPGAYPDKCPKCGYSPSEERMKAASK